MLSSCKTVLDKLCRVSCALFVFVIALPALSGCAEEQRGPIAPIDPAPMLHTQRNPDPASLHPTWAPLGQRLRLDGLYDADIDDVLRHVALPSQDPMGRKIQELYRNAFTPPQPPPAKGTPPPKPVYINLKIVNEETAKLCREFLVTHEDAFARAENAYGVPRSIAVALLFNETRLGGYLGKNDVFYTLASMAASRDAHYIPDWIAKLDNPAGREGWIQEKMEQRSDWAYKELTAFIRYARANNFQMLSVPGSVYGAMGLCQFMPTNLIPYGVDGNNDGLLNLFTVDDAIASLCNYLQKNGWKPGLSRAEQHRVLKRYNSLNIYANNILCLADMVRGLPIGKPVIPAKKK